MKGDALFRLVIRMAMQRRYELACKLTEDVRLQYIGELQQLMDECWREAEETKCLADPSS